MPTILLVALAGALGAVSRYALAGAVHRFTRTGFPVGTLAVNVIGCLLIGLLMHLVIDRQLLGPAARMALGVGFLGGFTTFSAFGFETFELLRGGSFKLAAFNVVLNVVGGLVAVWIGFVLPRALR